MPVDDHAREIAPAHQRFVGHDQRRAIAHMGRIVDQQRQDLAQLGLAQRAKQQPAVLGFERGGQIGPAVRAIQSERDVLD